MDDRRKLRETLRWLCEKPGAAGVELRNRRKALGWTQAQLAAQAYLNVETVLRCEGGGVSRLTTVSYNKIVMALEAGERAAE